MRLLSNEGLVEIIEGKGCFVAKINFEDMIEIFELRECLECFATKLFTERASDSVVAELESIFAEQEEAFHNNDHKAFMESDMHMHYFIAHHARNKRLETTLTSIYDQITRMAISVQSDVELRELAISEHKKLIKSIKSRDKENAVASMKTHISQVKHYHIDRYYLL